MDFLKMAERAKNIRNLNNYKGKQVIVHAVRPVFYNKALVKYQKFQYVGKINRKFDENISMTLGLFILAIGKNYMICKFKFSKNAENRFGECYVMSIEDAKTQQQIYSSDTKLNIAESEMLGNGVITGVENDELLKKYNQKPAILLGTYEVKNQKYMELLVAKDVIYKGKIPDGFELVNKDIVKLKNNSEDEEDLLLKRWDFVESHFLFAIKWHLKTVAPN